MEEFDCPLSTTPSYVFIWILFNVIMTMDGRCTVSLEILKHYEIILIVFISLSTTAFQNLTKGDKKRQTYSYLCLMFVWDFSQYRIWERGRLFNCNTFFWGSLAFQLVCFRLPHMSQTPEGSVSMHLCDPQTFCSTILVPQLLPASALDIHIWPSNWSVHQL